MTTSLAMAVATRGARATDRPALLTLLAAQKLPTDVPADLRHFVVAVSAGRVVAGAGLEGDGEARLLRSVVVDPAFQGRGLGRRLVESVVRHARAEGCRSLFLLTTSAQTFFARLGFVPCARHEVPEEVRRKAEFQGACPASAAVMRRSLE